MFSSNTSQVSNDANYIEDVFSTYLYTGNGSTQTITNNIDLAGKGGMVWLKARTSGGSSFTNNAIIDTARGANANGYYSIYPNLTDGQFSPTGSSDAVATAVNSTGFIVGGNANVNYNTQTDVSWTFRKQPKFFDIVTYTGNGTNGRTVSHSLGSVPGCMIVKRTDAANGWAVYHRSMNASPQDYMMRLNATDAAFTTSPSRWNNTLPTSTEFTLSGNDEVNGSGGTYVAYLFAHNAGGFGLTGTDNVISCGSASATAGTWTDVNVGFEPQWVLIKNSTATGSYNPSGSAGSQDWYVIDTMRGATAAINSNTSTVALSANSSIAEYNDVWFGLTSTGFSFKGVSSGSDSFIYIAIRRGPMKVPTSGTTVFQPASFTSTASRQTMGSLSVVDMFMGRRTNSIKDWGNASRLTGNYMLKPNLTDAQDTNVTGYGDSVLFDLQNGSSMITAGSGDPFITYNFHRAPSFFDEVCYTGTGSATTFSHNLGVVPELMIVKRRDSLSAWSVWNTYIASLDATNIIELNSTGSATSVSSAFNSTSPTSSVFTVGTAGRTNSSGGTYVAYLFATCAGVSKVGSYTGTGTTLQVNCGFTAGARFVLIKKTSGTGSWYVWDSARGIVSGNDPYLLLNSTAAEVTNTDYIDTYSAGFEISSTAPSEINENGGSFIFFAVA